MANIIDIVGNIGTGVSKGSSFGKIGTIAGGTIGTIGMLTADAVKKHDIETDPNGNGTLKGSMASGFVTGSFMSGISTGFEMYAHSHPDSIAAMESIKNNGEIIQNASVVDKLTNKKTYKNIHDKAKNLSKDEKNVLKKISNYKNSAIDEIKSSVITPESVFTSLTDYSMKTGKDGDELLAPLLDIMDNTKKNNIKGATEKYIDAMYDTVKNNMDSYDKNNNPWFSNKDIDININNKNVHIENNAPINERMASYVEANRNKYDKLINKYNEVMKDDSIKNTDDLIKYFKSTAPGGNKHDVLKNRGLYDKNKSKISKIYTTGNEIFNGSPLWNRETSRQKMFAKAKSSYSKNAKGKTIRKLESSTYNKAKRGLAATGDIFLGGAVMAGLYGIGHVLHNTLKGSEDNKYLDTNVIKANNSVEPMY